MKKEYISCKKASDFIERREQQALSKSEEIQLTEHIEICPLCQVYEQQSNRISRFLKHRQSLKESPDQLLEEEAKVLKENINNELNKR